MHNIMSTIQYTSSKQLEYNVSLEYQTCRVSHNYGVKGEKALQRGMQRMQGQCAANVYR